jgi:hypothetical protein
MNSEFRRKPRRNPTAPIGVVDAMTGQQVGRIGNISETGMLLIATASLVDDALYQFQFRLPGSDGEHTYEFGAHMLWKEGQSGSGMTWTGFRFIAVPQLQAERLRAWIAAAEQG